MTTTTKDTTGTTDTPAPWVIDPRVYPAGGKGEKAGQAIRPPYHMGPLTANRADRVRVGDAQVYGTRGFGKK
jgi:hypothetical protein